MRGLAILAIVAIGALIGAAPLFAHHGWSGYDSQNVLTLTGPLIRVDYPNPHVLIDLKVGDKSWNVVLAPSTRMHSRRLPDGVLKVGYPHKVEAGELRAERMTVAGKTIELR
ncbi:MAG: hypothetical protein EXQ92_00815 [Alphaproteobacteria bacterium]|nr:hypothetical protein [Alphaproteobacteria bacterium]